MSQEDQPNNEQRPPPVSEPGPQPAAEPPPDNTWAETEWARKEDKPENYETKQRPGG